MRVARIARSLGIVASTCSPAFAEEPNTALVHGLLAGELATAGVFTLAFSTRVLPNDGPATALNMLPPVVLGPLAAYGAHRGDLDPRPALALHGAGWLGWDLFMLGTLLDGRDKPWGVRVGKAAWVLGAIGTVGGGVIGATAITGRDDAIAWMVAPPAGFVLGGIGLGTILLLAGGIDGDHATGQFTTGAIIGTALGIGVGVVFADRGVGDTAPVSQPLVTQVEPSARRTFVSFGGSF